jgi:hypothetical protein
MSGPDLWQIRPPQGQSHAFPSYPQPKHITNVGPFGVGVAGKPPKETLLSLTWPAPRPAHRPQMPAPQPFWQAPRPSPLPPPTIPLPAPIPNRSVPGLPTGPSPLFNPPSPPTPPIHRPPHWRPPVDMPIRNPVTQEQRLLNIAATVRSAADAVVRHNPHLVPNPHFRLGAPPPPPPNITRMP